MTIDQGCSLLPYNSQFRTCVKLGLEQQSYGRFSKLLILTGPQCTLELIFYTPRELGTVEKDTYYCDYAYQQRIKNRCC